MIVMVGDGRRYRTTDQVPASELAYFKGSWGSGITQFWAVADSQKNNFQSWVTPLPEVTGWPLAPLQYLSCAPECEIRLGDWILAHIALDEWRLYQITELEPDETKLADAIRVYPNRSFWLIARADPEADA